MKKALLYITLSMACAAFTACGDDDLSSNSVVNDPVNEPTEFDNWLEENYRAPYNIRFLYRYEDIESDMDYDLAPAREVYSRIIAKMIRYLWLDPYTEVTDIHFMREFSPRLIQVIGSGAYNTNGTVQLGTAEGGLKITLYVGNWLEDFLEINYNNGADETDGYTVHLLSKNDINFYYLHTIHHEFAHILNQHKAYTTDFNTISKGDYAAQWNSLSDADAAEKGFISAYASSAPGEDFVEVFSYYVTLSDEEWAARLVPAGETGADRIMRKLAIVKDYMMKEWGMDVERLKEELDRRYTEIDALDWSDFNTK